MQRLEVSGAVRPIYESLGVKRLNPLVDTVIITPVRLTRNNAAVNSDVDVCYQRLYKC